MVDTNYSSIGILDCSYANVEPTPRRRARPFPSNRNQSRPSSTCGILLQILAGLWTMFALICWLFSAAAKTLLKALVVSNARLTYRISQAFVAGSQVGSEIVCASSSTLWRNTKSTAIVLGILAWIFWQTTH